jgi:hypothetical protein
MNVVPGTKSNTLLESVCQSTVLSTCVGDSTERTTLQSVTIGAPEVPSQDASSAWWLSGKYTLILCQHVSIQSERDQCKHAQNGTFQIIHL